MPRRKPTRTGNQQHSKGKKRPRGWHRRQRLRLRDILKDVKRHPKGPDQEGNA